MADVEGLYRKYGPMVLRRCRTLLKNEERSLDALQDVFVQLLRAGDRIRDEGLSSLLYTMATNICLNIIRKERREVSGDDGALISEIAWGENHEELTMARTLADGLFAGEKPDTRTLAVLHYVDGLTLEETAEAVGLSVSGVRKRLGKVKARGRVLREEL